MRAKHEMLRLFARRSSRTRRARTSFLQVGRRVFDAPPTRRRRRPPPSAVAPMSPPRGADASRAKAQQCAVVSVLRITTATEREMLTQTQTCSSPDSTTNEAQRWASLMRFIPHSSGGARRAWISSMGSPAWDPYSGDQTSWAGCA